MSTISKKIPFKVLVKSNEQELKMDSMAFTHGYKPNKYKDIEKAS